MNSLLMIVNKTNNYSEGLQKEKVSEKVSESIDEWAKSFNRTQSNRSKLFYRSSNNIFEIWAIRAPDPDHKKGASGGFRITCFIQIKEQIIFLYALERRKNIGFKNERPKDKQKYQNLLLQLKASLIEKLENS